MNKYNCYWNGKEATIEADSLYAAKVSAVCKWDVPRSKHSMVSVILVEKEGEAVTFNPASLG